MKDMDDSGRYDVDAEARVRELTLSEARHATERDRLRAEVATRRSFMERLGYQPYDIPVKVLQAVKLLAAERDALREQVRVLTLERDRQHAELDKRQTFMQRRGYVQCDIPACNCPYWHGGHAERRLDEIADALGSRVNGQTVLQAVEQLACEHAALAATAET